MSFMAPVSSGEACTSEKPSLHLAALIGTLVTSISKEAKDCNGLMMAPSDQFRNIAEAFIPAACAIYFLWKDRDMFRLVNLAFRVFFSISTAFK